MIQPILNRRFVRCCVCDKHEFRIDHISIGQKVRWSCDYCGNELHIAVSAASCDVEPTGKLQTPVTITLRSKTVPQITLKLHSWKYAHSEDESKEEYEGHQQYFYDEHTCPTNFMSQVEQIIFDGDTDPHGVFEFVSVEDGHSKVA
jgi:hypothetical protein